MGAAWTTETSEPAAKAVAPKMERIRTKKSPLINAAALIRLQLWPSRAFILDSDADGATSPKV
jgi:hypothetical protein